MREYSFRTTWVLAAPIERVWDVLAENERWPEWWRGAESVQVLEPGDADRVGELASYTWRARLPYRLEMDIRTTRVERPELCEGRVSGGLRGLGRWRLEEDAGRTTVTFEWQVATANRWMNALAPLARPVFRSNHDWVMRNGGSGLARRLGVTLVAAG
jgi:uncharacterized protein YndB with AHSA1/START domain